MATYYVDNVDGVNSNNGTSDTTPVKVWNTANIGSGTFAPGDRLLFKSGVVYDGSGGRVAPVFSSSPTATNRFYVGSYGGTERAILDGGGTRDIGFRPAAAIDQANPPTYVTVENLEIRNYTSNGLNFGEVSADGTHVNGAILNNLYVHKITSTSEAAIKSWGTGVTVSNCRVEMVGGDGIFLQGAYAWVHHNTIRWVSNTGGTLGDGIQFNANSHYSLIEYNYIERENSDKQALLVCGDYCVIRHNTLKGLSVGAGLLTLFNSTGTSTGNQVYGNYLYGTDGIYLLDATGAHRVFGNVIVGTNRNETEGNSTGIDMNGSVNHQVFNNTVIGHQRGIRCQSATAYNNIVIDCGGVGIDTGSGASSESHNCAHRNGTNFSGTPGTGSVQVDPALTPTYMVTSASVRAAGTTVDAVDFYGNSFNNSMGAVQYSAPRPLATRSLATRTTTTRTVATLRGQTA